MYKTWLFCLLFICSLAAAPHNFAQTPKPAKSPAPAATPGKKCEAQLARLLVDQLASDSKSIEETDKRINVLIKVADFLWVPDVETARQLFTEAFQIARERYKEKGFETISSKGGLVTQKPDYRFHVIRAIALRDAKWARELTEIVLKDRDEESKDAKRGPFDDEREVSEILRIAVALADMDQASASAFFARAMQFPLGQDWYFTMYSLAGKNRAMADKLYPDLLRTYANAEVSRLLVLSAYPFAAPRIIGLGRYSMGTSLPAGLTPNRALQKQFLDVFFRRVNLMTAETGGQLASGDITESAYALAALNELEQTMAQFPEMIELFAQSKTTIAGIITEEARQATAEGEKRNDSSANFESKIAALEKAEDEGKLTDSMIAHLLLGINKEKHFELLESWLDKITDTDVKTPSIEYFYFARSKLALTEKRFEEARKYADKENKIEHRAVLYLGVAEAKIKDPATRFDALDSLNEVYKMAQKAPDSVEKAQVFLGLAFHYEGIDHANALDALSNAVKTCGKLNSPNLFQTFMMQRIVGKDFGIFIGYETPGFALGNTVYELSKKDFQGTLTQVEGFSDRYLRTVAVLAVVKDCEKSLKPAVKPKVK